MTFEEFLRNNVNTYEVTQETIKMLEVAYYMGKVEGRQEKRDDDWYSSAGVNC